MNLAIVMGYLAQRYGGPPHFAIQLGMKLKQNGVSVTWWATATGPEKEELAYLGDSARLYPTVFPRSWFRSPDLVCDLTSQAPSFDLFHIHGTWTHPIYAGVKIARKAGVPYLITPHGTLGPWSLGKRRLKKKLYLILLGRRIFEKAACLHAMTCYEAEHFRMAGYRGPITIIPSGFDVGENTELPDKTQAEAYWPDLKDRPVVLLMSRLSAEKGLDQLIPVWADLVKSRAYKDALLVIAGPDDRGYQKVVEGIIDRCGVDSKILLTGMVRGRKKFALLRRADVFILPSYSENFGIVVAEALACETPVITTTGTPWRDLQDVDAGRWVPPRGPELGRALRELLSMSESERQAMGRRGRNLIKQNYAWDTIVGKILTVYDCILSGKPVPLHPKPLVGNIYPEEHL